MKVDQNIKNVRNVFIKSQPKLMQLSVLKKRRGKTLIDNGTNTKPLIFCIDNFNIYYCDTYSPATSYNYIIVHFQEFLSGF